MIYPFTSYLKFLTGATNQHGVHSPFVYNLLTQCFYDRSYYPAYDALSAHRKALLADDSTISVTDLGAGSRVFKSEVRKISAIARHAGMSIKRQKLLYRLTRFHQPNSILELGTSLGLSTFAMALGHEHSAITTLEGCPATANKTKEYFNRFGVNNIEILNTDFNTYLSGCNESFDLIYVDGNHTEKDTLRYFELLLKCIHHNSIVILDDIHWSREMNAAWKKIIANKQVTVSIDTFQWGLIFFRKEQKKQDFRIRV